MVGPNGLEPSTSSVSRKRSNQTELRAYMRTVVVSILRVAGNSGNVWTAITEKIEIHYQELKHAESRADHGLENSWYSL